MVLACRPWPRSGSSFLLQSRRLGGRSGIPDSTGQGRQRYRRRGWRLRFFAAAGSTFKGLFPFHDDHNPSFTVDPKRQRYRCWSCQKSGDVIFFIQEHERVGFPEALELLARRAGITLEKRADSPQKRQRAFMLDGVRWAADQFQRCLLDSPLAEGARRYLGERRLTGETVRRFGLGFAPATANGCAVTPTRLESHSTFWNRSASFPS